MGSSWQGSDSCSRRGHDILILHIPTEAPRFRTAVDTTPSNQLREPEQCAARHLEEVQLTGLLKPVDDSGVPRFGAEASKLAFRRGAVMLPPCPSARFQNSFSEAVQVPEKKKKSDAGTASSLASPRSALDPLFAVGWTVSQPAQQERSRRAAGRLAAKAPCGGGFPEHLHHRAEVPVRRQNPPLLRRGALSEHCSKSPVMAMAMSPKLVITAACSQAQEQQPWPFCCCTFWP